MAKKTEKVALSVFKVTGSFKIRKKSQTFSKEVLKENKQKAEEYILSVLGSKHHLKRKEIKITNIEKIPTDQVSDMIIKQMLGGQ
jgi:ribosomal protein L20A (L18A)